MGHNLLPSAGLGSRAARVPAGATRVAGGRGAVAAERLVPPAPPRAGGELPSQLGLLGGRGEEVEETAATLHLVPAIERELDAFNQRTKAELE